MESHGFAPAAASVFVAVVVTLGAAGPVAAQDPAPTPAPGSANEDPHPWRGSADLGLTVTDGNSESLSLSLGAKASRRFDRERLAFSGSFIRTTEDGEEVADQGSFQAGYDYFATERFFLASMFRAEFNDPAGLSRRLAPGLGLGYELLDRERVTLSVQAGGNWIQDHFVNDSTVDAVYVSFRQNFQLTINETTRLDQELRYNPRASDVSDYLLHGEATLTTEISDLIGLRVTLRDDYDSTPFPGGPGEPPREKNDLTFITGVTFQF